MNDGREARFISEYESVKTYLKRTLGEGEYDFWQGNEKCFIYKKGFKYPVEIGEIRFLIGNDEIAEPSPYITAHPFSEAEKALFKVEALRYRAPRPIEPMLEGKSQSPEPGVTLYLTLPNLPDQITNAPIDNVFVYWRWGTAADTGDDTGKYCKYVQCIRVRVDRPGRPKKFTTWTCFEGNKWVSRAPEGFHRIYGLASLRDMAISRIFLHEGEKAVDRVRRALKEGTLLSPVDEFLGGPGVAHLGWGFGALTPHRVDWDYLRQFLQNNEVKELVIVPDNDEQGRNSIRVISRALAGARFNIHRFIPKAINAKESWDFGDGIPEHNWGKDQSGKLVWNKSSLDTMLRPANWATVQVGTNTNGNPIYAPSQAFIKDCIYVPSLGSFVFHSNPNLMLNLERTKAAVRNYSDTPLVIEKFLDRTPDHASRVAFMPDKELGLIWHDDENELIFNQYKDLRPPAVQGDVTIFYEFIFHLVPDEEERQCLMEWIATLLVFPERNMDYGVLLWSKTQGVGKGLLISMIRRFIGSVYTAEPSDNMLTESKYNGYAYNKLLIACHEIYAQENYRAVDKMKSLITERRIIINQKYGAEFEADNVAKIIACSNSDHALALTHEDRRWLVVHGVEKKISPQLVKKFVHWFTQGNGLSALRWHLENEWEKKTGYTFVPEGSIAPMTAAKEQVIEKSKPQYVEFACDILDHLSDEEGKKEFIPLAELKVVMKSMNTKFPKDSVLLEKLVEAGWSHSSNIRNNDRDERIQVWFNEKRKRVVLVGKDDNLARYSGEEINDMIKNGLVRILSESDIRERIKGLRMM